MDLGTPAFFHGFRRSDWVYQVLKKKTRHPTHLSWFLVVETRLRPSPVSGQLVFGSVRVVWAGGSVPGFPWTPLAETFYCFRTFKLFNIWTPPFCTNPNTWLTPTTWRCCWLQNSSLYQQWRSKSTWLQNSKTQKTQ